MHALGGPLRKHLALKASGSCQRCPDSSKPNAAGRQQPGTAMAGSTPHLLLAWVAEGWIVETLSLGAVVEPAVESFAASERAWAARGRGGWRDTSRMSDPRSEGGGGLAVRRPPRASMLAQAKTLAPAAPCGQHHAPWVADWRASQPALLQKEHRGGTQGWVGGWVGLGWDLECWRRRAATARAAAGGNPVPNMLGGG